MPESKNPIAPKPGGTLLGPLWVILLGLMLGLGLGYYIASTAPDFETLALGAATKSVYGRYAGDKIFCGSVEEAPECLTPARQRGLAKRVVWLGNSQLHAINQPKPTDLTAPVLLAGTLRPKGIEVQAMSFPNASLAELYLASRYLQNDHPIDVLVVPLFLDDTREGAVREALRPMAEVRAVADALAASAAGRAVKGALPANHEPGGAVTESDTSLQARSEAAITAWLEKCCGFQTMREKARGQIQVQAFYFRNWLFDVNAQTVRPIIPESYELNLNALGQLLADAQRDRIKVIVYIPPLRQDVRPPYNPADYARFKADTKVLAERYGAQWVNIDNIVAGPLWGMKEAPVTGGALELDFMHFQEPGHVAVERALRPYIETALQ